jgi:DNA-directed RNA polymerase subunit L
MMTKPEEALQAAMEMIADSCQDACDHVRAIIVRERMC